MLNRGGISISHVFYAGDIMTFVKSDKKGVKNVMKMIDKFSKLTGQTISKQKSVIFCK